MENKGLAVPLEVPNNTKRAFQCRKIEEVEGEGLILTYVVAKNDTPLYEVNHDYELKVLFAGRVESMQMYTDSCTSSLEYKTTGKGWIFEVTGSPYLKLVNDNCCGTIEGLRHYMLVTINESYDIITDYPPEFTVVNTSKAAIMKQLVNEERPSIWNDFVYIEK